MAGAPTDSFIIPAAASGAATRRIRSAESPSVVVRNLQFSYGEGDLAKQVLFDNNLELMPGEIVIMTGPSGSGKTTLLTLIGGLRSVQHGELEVLGRPLHRLPRKELTDVRRRIGFIFQAHNLFESLTAYQNVHIALELDTHPPQYMHQRTIELLNKLGLGNRLTYKPAALSGGQRQRVAIARALVHAPRLILADEPTAALDRASGREVIRLFQELAEQQRTTILLVTHDNRILDAAHRIVNMVDGRIISNVHVQESAEIVNFLRRCPLFGTLTPGQIGTMADQVAYERHPTGAVIVRKGDPGDKFYVIRSGHVKVVDREGLRPGEEPELGPGEFFGEVALLTGEPRNATVVATTEVELYSLGKQEFTAVLRESETFEEEVRKIVFERQ
jgi:putative ABC transport system ATP-binding protein